MTKLDDLARELEDIVDAHRIEDHIPGVSLAVGLAGEVVEYATGVVNVDTGVETTPDSLFQIGSITKTFTAALVMQLVDESLVNLDKPVRTYVPEFSVADLGATETLTVRQLLCHTGGFDGDVFEDFGRGDDAVTRYVAALKNREQIFAPGQRYSYCTAGYCVLGRLVERLRGVSSWDAALRTHLIEPLGLAHTVSLPEEAVLFRTAVGHVDLPRGGAAEQRVAPAPQFPRATAPAGAAACSSARDLITWARLHLCGGVAPDGTRVLSAASIAAMQETHAVLPGFEDGSPRQTWGLGWQLTDYEGGRVFGHSGATIGQSAMLEVAPETGAAYALLTNGGAPMRMIHAIRTRVFRALAGIEVPPRPKPPSRSATVDPHRFVGRYHDASMYYDIRQADDGGLIVEVGLRGPLQEQLQEKPKSHRVIGVGPSTLITSVPENGVHRRLAFPETDARGRATSLFNGARFAVRVDAGGST